MAVRTTERLVQEILGDDWGGCRNLTGFIASASVVVDRVVSCATRKGITLTTKEKELVERWLAAHFYVMSDQVAQSESQGGQSASMQGQLGRGFEASKYGQAAMAIDPSNCLQNIDKSQTATFYWGGKARNDQQSYEERN